MEVFDPPTEEACATIVHGTTADTDKAVAAAKAAFAPWSATEPSERLALVKRILEVYQGAHGAEPRTDAGRAVHRT
ncbi:aldehyde dehydrogenase family protein [Mesorhizobium sp. 1B3]|uniref:aldehyde dehydrogenase family protein n=1 Tax=Mesorhizobium sp. 1B3 TaxID=3243599 RepID=UPI003D964E84